jgi:TRAP-type mannitol/chloroaromatic compound transport system permease small subunit
VFLFYRHRQSDLALWEMFLAILMPFSALMVFMKENSLRTSWKQTEVHVRMPNESEDEFVV